MNENDEGWLPKEEYYARKAAKKTERAEFLRDTEKNPYLSQAGRIATLSEEERKEMASKGGKAKAENARQRKIMEAKLKDKDSILREATASVMSDDPAVIEKIMSNLARMAQSDDKSALQAADFFLKHSGITAPKKTEAIVEQKGTVEETVEELEQLGVNIKGLRVVK